MQHPPSFKNNCGNPPSFNKNIVGTTRTYITTNIIAKNIFLAKAESHTNPTEAEGTRGPVEYLQYLMIFGVKFC